MFGRSKRQPTVLVMETSHLVSKLLAHLLEREGVQAICVETAEAALAILHLDHPELVLVGVRTAESNGLDLIHGMRSDAELRDIPVVVMAATADEGACQRALKMGATGYLPKPFTVAAVANLVDEHFRARAPRKPSLYSIGILSDCDLQRHQLKHVLATNGYQVTVNCRPQQVFQNKPSDIAAVRLWLLDQPEHEEDEFLMQLADGLGGEVLFGMGRPPKESGSSGILFMQWERRLLNKVEISLYGRVITRSSEFVGGAHRELACLPQQSLSKSASS